MQRWLARLAFSFIILTVVLAWSGRQAARRGDSPTGYYAAAALPPHLIDALVAKQVTWVTFTSSSTARNFVTLLGDDYKQKLAGVKLASIGPITTATLRELGLSPTIEAKQFNIAGVVAAIAEARGG